MKKTTETLINSSRSHKLKIIELRRLVTPKSEDQVELRLYANKYEKNHDSDRFIAQGHKREFLNKNLSPTISTLIFNMVQIMAYQNSNKSYQPAIHNRTIH